MKDRKKIRNLSEDEIKRNERIVQSLIYYAIPIVNKIWKSPKVVEWLEEEIGRELWNKMTEELQDDLFYEKAQLFLNDFPKGYRHVKGFALECACVDLLQSILRVRFELDEFDDDFVKKILDKCNENLNVANSKNLDSMKIMVKFSENFPVSDIYITRFENLKPEWAKGIVLSIIHGMKNDRVELNGWITLSDLLLIYDDIDPELRKKIMGINYYSVERLVRKIKPHMAYAFDNIYNLFKIEWRFGKDTLEFSPTNEEIKKIDFGALGAKCDPCDQGMKVDTDNPIDSRVTKDTMVTIDTKTPTGQKEENKNIEIVLTYPQPLNIKCSLCMEYPVICEATDIDKKTLVLCEKCREKYERNE
jgi:hypothetical protein